MKKYKAFLFAVLPVLAISFLTGCGNKNNNNNNNEPEEEEPKPLEIGDTVKEWCSIDDYEEMPIDLQKGGNSGSGTGVIVNDFGHYDEYSLKFDVKNGNNSQGYIGSDSLEEPYFAEDDAKNGDEITIFFYVPQNSNLSSLQLQIKPTQGDAVLGKAITITPEKEENWFSSLVTFDSLYTLGGIGFIYKVKDASSTATFYVDDINITLAEETVKTGYKSNGESLYQTYEENFKVGTCMSSSMLRNTEMRKIVRENFNSITAENEGKPEQILDKDECQKLAKTNQSAVAITTKPFEKIYDFAAKNNIMIRHHTFVWYSQTPGWFFNEGYADNGNKVTRAVMLKRMENFIRVTLDTINERWPERVYAIDVANEAIDNGIRKNNNNWYTVVGEDFVARAFEYAYKYKEDYQELYYNDYSFDYNTNNCEFALETLLKEPIKEGWIDGVGIQAHIDSDQNMDVMFNDAKMIHDKGLKCQLTEIDITVNGTDAANLKKQKDAYNLLLKRILKGNEDEETDVNGMIVWGITDDTSWKRGQNPLLFNSNYEKKPAYYGFLEAIDQY